MNSTTMTLGDAATDTLTINAGPVNFPNATAAADALILGADANLYRSAADTLKTDDSFIVNANLTIGGNRMTSVNAAVAAAGSTQATATALTKDLNNVTSSTAVSAIGVILPTAIAGMEITILNNSANTINIYPATSAQINALGANNPLTLTAGSKSRVVATTSTQWYTLN